MLNTQMTTFYEQGDLQPTPIQILATKPKLSLATPPPVEPITEEWVQEFITKHDIKIEARPYQLRIVKKAINMILFDGTKSILIESSTGSGKSVIGLLLCKLLQELLGYNTNWCTMRRNLLTQTGKIDKEKNFNVAPELVSMFDKNPKRNGILLVDECQHMATTSAQNICSKTQPKIILLLSATPVRADRAALFFEKKILDSGPRALIRDGYLSQFNHFTINEWSVKSVSETYLREIEKWGKTAIFLHRYEQCVEMQNIFNKAGIKSEVITAKTNREEQLQAFEKGNVDVVINLMILTEGWDFSALNTVMVRPSYDGGTIQMCGRVLRLFEGRVKNIIQSRNSPYPFTRLASAKGKFLWDDRTSQWKELQTNKLVESIIADSLKQLATVALDETIKPTKLIEFLKKKRLIKPKGYPRRNR